MYLAKTNLFKCDKIWFFIYTSESSTTQTCPMSLYMLMAVLHAHFGHVLKGRKERERMAIVFILLCIAPGNKNKQKCSGVASDVDRCVGFL